MIRLGVIGCGGFGLFALQHFAQLPGVQPVAMAGPIVRHHSPRPAASACRTSRKSKPCWIATTSTWSTSPRRRFCIIEQSLAALQHGKHVICEKPLAVTVEQADELVTTSRERGLLLATNLMQRYNPLFDAVKALDRSSDARRPVARLFRELRSRRRARAAALVLGPSKSGGIFIEHGVHFFDLFAGWLGPGKVVSAQASTRPGSGFEDQVQCAVRYADGALVNFYHGFTQAGRWTVRNCGSFSSGGTSCSEEWIPSRFRIHAIADEAQTRELCEIFPARPPRRDGRLRRPGPPLPRTGSTTTTSTKCSN